MAFSTQNNCLDKNIDVLRGVTSNDKKRKLIPFEKEIMEGDIQSAKFLLIKAKELLSSLTLNNEEGSEIAS